MQKYNETSYLHIHIKNVWLDDGIIRVQILLMRVDGTEHKHRQS